MTLSNIPLGRSVSHRFIVTPEYVERRTANVSREQLTQDLYSTLGDLYGMANIFGSLEVLDFPEYISPGGSLQIRFMQIRGVGGFTELADENILLYPPDEHDVEPPSSIPIPTLEEVNAPFVEGNLWQQSLGVTAVFAEPLTAPVFNSNWTRNAGVNSRDFLVTNDPITTTEAIRLDAAGGVTRVPGLFDGPVGSGGGGGGAAILGPGGGGGVTLNGYISNVVTGDFLENLAKRLSISTEVSRDRDNLVVKTSLFLERDDTSLITVDSFEGHIDIDELKD